MADSWRHHWGARALRGFLLGPVVPGTAVSNRAVDRDLHGAARRTGFLRRPHRGHRGGLDLCLEKPTAGLEVCRRTGAEHRARLRAGPTRLPDERLLLWPRDVRAVGHPLSVGSRNPWARRSPPPDLRFTPEPRTLRHPGPPAPEQAI